MSDEQERAEGTSSGTSSPVNSSGRQETNEPGKGTRNTILLIGLLSIGSIACMCAFIFTLVAV